MNEVSYKIQLHLLVNSLFNTLDDLKELDSRVNRKRVNLRAKDIIDYIKNFKGTELKYDTYKDYKRLCRDLPSHKYEPNITELENLKKLISSPKIDKPVQTFESLFRDPDKAKDVKEIFEIKGYTINGQWQGLSEDRTELLAAYYTLKPILKGKKDTPKAKIFYNEFGLKVAEKGEYITERSLTNEPFNNNRDEFERIFAHLLPSK